MYVDADVFALLSRHEPWGVAVNEAAASGSRCSSRTEWARPRICCMTAKTDSSFGRVTYTKPPQL